MTNPASGRAYLPLLACAALVIGACSDPPPPPYDPGASPTRDRDLALDRARNDNKTVLMVFGANWCPDCRALHEQMHRGRLARLIDARYVPVYVDIGEWDRNMDFAAEYGNPTAQGIPAIVALDAGGNVLAKSAAGELARARRMSASELLDWFERIGTDGGS